MVNAPHSACLHDIMSSPGIASVDRIHRRLFGAIMHRHCSSVASPVPVLQELILKILKPTRIPSTFFRAIAKCRWTHEKLSEIDRSCKCVLHAFDVDIVIEFGLERLEIGGRSFGADELGRITGHQALHLSSELS